MKKFLNLAMMFKRSTSNPKVEPSGSGSKKSIRRSSMESIQAPAAGNLRTTRHGAGGFMNLNLAGSLLKGQVNRSNKEALTAQTCRAGYTQQRSLNDVHDNKRPAHSVINNLYFIPKLLRGTTNNSRPNQKASTPLNSSMQRDHPNHHHTLHQPAQMIGGQITSRGKQQQTNWSKLFTRVPKSISVVNESEKKRKARHFLHM